MTLDPKKLTEPWTAGEMAHHALQVLSCLRKLPGDEEGGFYWLATLGPGGESVILETSHGAFVVTVKEV